MTENHEEAAAEGASLAESAAAWVPPWSRAVDGDAEGGDGDESDSGEGDGASGEPVAAPAPEVEAELAASWVPPWARDLPDLVIEPASDNPVSLEPWWTSMPDQPEEGAPEDPTEPRLPEAELRAAVEAILLVVDEPVGEIALAQVLEEPTARIGEVLRQLAEEYAASSRGYELRHAAGGWRLYTRSEYASYVERFILDGQSVRLTQAALETLAVVAYKQPVTRSRVSAIRGVNCDGVIKTLMGRGLVEECGTEPESGAYLYRTTPLFLEKLGINSTEELPGLAPFLPDNIDEIDSASR